MQEHGHHYKLDEAPYQDALEAKYLNNDKFTFFDVGIIRYRLNFKNMTQKNLTSGTKCKIRRRPTFQNLPCLNVFLPSIFVIFETDQTYPKYMILYEDSKEKSGADYDTMFAGGYGMWQTAIASKPIITELPEDHEAKSAGNYDMGLMAIILLFVFILFMLILLVMFMLYSTSLHYLLLRIPTR